MQIEYSYFNPYLLFLIGSIALYFSSELIISNSLSLSESFNISKITIGIIVLALGTSLPELFVSIIAVINGNDNIVIGNIIGSIMATFGMKQHPPNILGYGRGLSYSELRRCDLLLSGATHKRVNCVHGEDINGEIS